jgi:hypothetical protein
VIERVVTEGGRNIGKYELLRLRIKFSTLGGVSLNVAQSGQSIDLGVDITLA